MYFPTTSAAFAAAAESFRSPTSSSSPSSSSPSSSAGSSSVNRSPLLPKRDNEYTTEGAKKLYFLSTDELRYVPFYKPGGWGCGHLKLYDGSDLEAAAFKKYGEAGFLKKLATRSKREANKKEREVAAAKASAALASGEVLVSVAAGQPASPASAAAIREGANAIRREAFRSLCNTCTWDFLRSKRSEHGANATVLVERVEQRVFAALIGREADPELLSVVKNGAWHSIALRGNTVFTDRPRGRGGPHGSNG